MKFESQTKVQGGNSMGNRKGKVKKKTRKNRDEKVERRIAAWSEVMSWLAKLTTMKYKIAKID